jgi:DNA-binding transcriptional MocR family regulator
MTIHQNTDPSAELPKYLAIANSIARAVETGGIKPGSRLPTHRALAVQESVTIGTVSRAYDELYRRGLVVGEVGRGTFVRSLPTEATRFGQPDNPTKDAIDLSLNLPVPGAQVAELARVIVELVKRGRLNGLLGYAPHLGTARHRAAGAEWIGRSGLKVSLDEVVVTNGAQHAIFLALSTLARPGDVILTEGLTYPGVKTIASMLHLRLEGVAIDATGLRPEAFQDACEKHRPKALYCMPTVQNPTASVMNEQRRRRIADIARMNHVAVIEDDTYGFLAPDAPRPITARAESLGFYITTMSKSVAPGVRIGYLRAPRGSIPGVSNAMMATNWTVSPITAEIATAWIEDGAADAAVQWRRREARARSDLAAKILGPKIGREISLPALHFWMPLPPPWRADELVREARMRGVILSPPELFVVGRASAPHAIRICLGATRDRETLKRGLSVIASLLNAERPQPAAAL